MSPRAVTGLLFSQIGYDAGEPARMIVRGATPDFLPESAEGVLRRAPGGTEAVRVPLRKWGELWGSSWWVADLGLAAECGSFSAHVCAGGREVLAGPGLLIKRNVLWDSTWLLCGADMLERRHRFAKAKPG